jgi:hypothetical protein
MNRADTNLSLADSSGFGVKNRVRVRVRFTVRGKFRIWEESQWGLVNLRRVRIIIRVSFRDKLHSGSKRGLTTSRFWPHSGARPRPYHFLLGTSY